MPLHFAASQEYVNHGSGGSIDNLDAQTWLFWSRPISINNTNRRMIRKGGNMQMLVGGIAGGDGKANYFRGRATTATGLRSDDNFFTANAWKFWGVSDNDGAPPLLYDGGLTSLVALYAGTYEDQTAGSGSPSSDAADDLLIGSRNNANSQCDHEIAYQWTYNRVLTLGEVRHHQYRPQTAILSGCVQKTAYLDTTHIKDLSGNGNHGTVNGTPDVVAGVPVTTLWKPDQFIVTAPVSGADIRNHIIPAYTRING